MSVLALAREEKAAQSGLMERLVDELVALWRALFGDRAATRADVDDFVELVVPLVQQYGAASGHLARDFYERQRAEAGVTDRYEVPLVDPPDREQIAASVAWALNPERHRNALDPDARRDRDERERTAAEERERAQREERDQGALERERRREDEQRQRELEREEAEERQRRARERERRDREYEEFERQQERERRRDLEDDRDPVDLDRLGERQRNDLTGAMPRLARQTGRLTLENAVDQDPRAVAYARVLGSSNPCSLCVAAASRGFVYRSAESALYKGGTREKYHDRCACTIVVTWASRRGELPEESREADDLWRRSGAKFGNRKDAFAALQRALNAKRDGRNIDRAVLDGPPEDPDRYRRKTRGGVRGRKRKSPAVPGPLPADDLRRVLA